MRTRLARPVGDHAVTENHRSFPERTPRDWATRRPSLALIRYSHRYAGLPEQSSHGWSRRYGASFPHAFAADSVRPPHVEWYTVRAGSLRYSATSPRVASAASRNGGAMSSTPSNTWSSTLAAMS